MADRDIDALAGSTGAELRTPAFAEWAGGDVVTLAIAFTDLVGSTALNEDIKDELMNAVRQAHFAQSRKLVEQHAGREIKTIGDAFMVVFRSVDRALDYALALQAAPGRPELKNRVRAGIHIGRILVDEGDVFGREVNFAARVVGAIKGAEIWLSDPAMHDIDKLGAYRFSELRWELRGDASMKGFEGTYRLWSLVNTDPLARAEVSNASASIAYSGSRPARSGVVESSTRREFDARAQNYDRVDFVSAAEVVIDQNQDGSDRGVYAQVDFVERLYVESPRARVEFGVRRAFVSVENDGPGSLMRADHLRLAATRRNAKFVTLHDAPQAISLCIEPDPGKTSLTELALPPTPRENYLCQIATAAAEVEVRNLHGELRVSLDVEGLWLADDITLRVTPTKKKQIEAIIEVAAKKNHHRVENGEIRRPLEVRERRR